MVVTGYVVVDDFLRRCNWKSASLNQRVCNTELFQYYAERCTGENIVIMQVGIFGGTSFLWVVFRLYS